MVSPTYHNAVLNQGNAFANPNSSVTIGTPGAVPEPSSVILAGLGGGLALAGAGRRSSRATARAYFAGDRSRNSHPRLTAASHTVATVMGRCDHRGRVIMPNEDLQARAGRLDSWQMLWAVAGSSVVHFLVVFLTAVALLIVSPLASR